MTRTFHVVAGGSGQLGAVVEPDGTGIAVWAPHADAVDVCVRVEGKEIRLRLPESSGGVWHGKVVGLGAGDRYGFRAHGPWEPEHGRCFDAETLLVDPYAEAITFDGDQPLGVIVDTGFDWMGTQHPQLPWTDTVIYEAHVRGLTIGHPDVPDELRGTYAGLAHPALIDHLRRLGVTAVELLPVQQYRSEPSVLEHGLTNYWGYNTLGFFAPHGAYAAAGDTGGQVAEFKQMVRSLHTAGIEVILDVVYNHTCEGGLDGPIVSWRGLDDDSYYRRTVDGDYFDVTGCGNTVRTDHPTTLRMIMDSLRYWVEQMHVDGFRFDLASALARTDNKIDKHAALLAAIGQDPVLRATKLIAEPWDISADGYLVGGFPAGWCEWNGQFRDTVRDFWRGRGGVRDLALRLSGSSDLYADDGRAPFASVNFVTAHDGFTLRDLVSYADKHNEVNREHNHDGTDDNRSSNGGIEGETDDPGVVAWRQRQTANLLATLLLSTGVPMVTAGDERGRTQGGNNNAYCQDNEISWIDWAHNDRWAHLLDLMGRVTALRRQHPALRRRHFFDGLPAEGAASLDLTWVHPGGHRMGQTEWSDDTLQSLGMALRAARDDEASLLVLAHAGGDPVDWKLPAGGRFRVLLDTSGTLGDQTFAAAEVASVAAQSLVVLQTLSP